MLKITILALSLLVVVASAEICCSDSQSLNAQKVPPKKAADSKAIRTPKVAASPKAEPSVPATQVLVLKTNERIDRRLILDRKMGRNFDWRFISRDKEAKYVVFAHKSIVFKYSSLLKIYSEKSHESGVTSDLWMMYYPVPIIESLVNLMYEHKVTINASNYDTIMAAAKSILIQKLIGTSESNGEFVVAKQK